MDRVQEFEAKLSKVRGLLEERSLEVIVLSRRSNFAWLTGGGQNHVGVTTDFGAASLFIEHHQVLLQSSNIESARLMEEECAGLPLVPWVFDWSTDAIAAFNSRRLQGAPYGTDGGPWGGGVDLSNDLMRLRHPLMPAEVDRYRQLGGDAEQAMSEACYSLRPGMTEFQAAALLTGKCLERGIEATVRLVAFDERIDRFRHPIPTVKTLVKRALMVLGARRQGLIVSLSRMVSLGPIDSELRRKHDSVCRVDTVLNLHSNPGQSLSGILKAGITQYDKEGFPEEWHLHHQGGLTGYEGRDIRATPRNDYVLNSPTAVAWNPSITGTKSEDTFLVTEKGPENLTESKKWPKVTSETDKGTLDRCDILEL
jgi:Xaa-Pro aminopeptidase